jgi:hypothetical protein
MFTAAIAIGVRIGQRLEQHGPDDAEHCSACANAQRQRARSNGGERGRPPQPPDGAPQVDEQRLDSRFPADGTHFLSYRHRATQIELRRAACLVCGEPLFPVGCGRLGEVVLDFVGDVPIGRRSPDERAKPADDLSKT